MAPTRGATGKSPKVKPTGVKGKKVSNTSSPSRVTKSKAKHPSPKEVKSKSRSAPELLKKTKRRVYTEKELDLPTLNMITPAGVQKQKGRKKGKIFVDDQESMMTILAMVNAEKEGQIESKMIKARQMEEIREARRKEAETRQEQRKSKLELIKDGLRKKKSKGKRDAGLANPSNEKPNGDATKSNGKRKSVTFA